MSTFTTRSWDALVRAADPDFLRESLHPIVWFFSGPKGKKRDKGPDSDLYQPAPEE